MVPSPPLLIGPLNVIFLTLVWLRFIKSWTIWEAGSNVNLVAVRNGVGWWTQSTPKFIGSHALLSTCLRRVRFWRRFCWTLHTTDWASRLEVPWLRELYITVTVSCTHGLWVGWSVVVFPGLTLPGLPNSHKLSRPDIASQSPNLLMRELYQDVFTTCVLTLPSDQSVT